MKTAFARRALLCAVLFLAFSLSLFAVERMKVDRWSVAAPVTQRWTLSAPVAAATELLVFRNGVLMSEGTDYARSGQEVTFTDQKLAEGDLVVFVYFTPVL